MRLRKVLLIIIGICLLSGCGEKKVSIQPTSNDQKKEETVTEQYIDENPIKIGLYDNVGQKYILYKSYSTNMAPDVDMDYYQIVFSNEEEVSFNGNREDYIKSLWDNTNINFKLGIMLEYDTLNDGHIKHVLYNPDTILEHQPYFAIYMYDAIKHRYDKWYSHITSEEFDDNTYVTSFKLTPGSKISELTSPLKLSVFTYDTEDDFDEDGNYRGNSIYTIEISKN